MGLFGHKLLVLFVALLASGITQLCACLTMADQPAVAVATEVDPHACCKSEGSQPDQPQTPDDCPHCDKSRQINHTTPEPRVELSPLALAFDLPPVLIEVLTDQPSSFDQRAEDVPIPRLLNDLFHQSCLLTI